MCGVALGLSVCSPGSGRASLLYGFLYHTIEFFSNLVILALLDYQGHYHCGYLLQFPGARKDETGLCGCPHSKVPCLVGTLGSG